MSLQTQEYPQDSPENKTPKKRRVARGLTKALGVGAGLLAFSGAADVSAARNDTQSVSRRLDIARETGVVIAPHPETGQLQALKVDSPQALEQLSDHADSAADKSDEGLRNIIVGTTGAAMVASGLAATRKNRPE